MYRDLGLAQYLAKFMPHLSDITKPLRDLTRQDCEWMWHTTQQAAVDELKKAVTSAPVLRYYDLKEEVTIQCDASQSGLGAALLQNGQPVAYASRALTSAETRYAQIEKELLSIVFACDRFEAYIYGRDNVHVETDHKPLESIVVKPLNCAPKRLQRMLLRLQKYTVQERCLYVFGRYVEQSVFTRCQRMRNRTRSRRSGPQTVTSGHKRTMATTRSRVRRRQRDSETGRNDTERLARQTTDVPESIRPYYDSRDELTVQGNLVFKGQQLVVPVAVRSQLMAVAHASHIGIEGCIRRLRDCLYWPRMTTQMKDYVSKCDICASHRSAPPRESLRQHDFAARPWSKVGADLCELQGRTLLVICDYYSNFIEVARLQTVTIHAALYES